MPDNAVMTCTDIPRLIKRLQDDLLSEQEYQAFFNHLDGCNKCQGYVRSLGSISWQLWELGQVQVPSDLASTILYQIQHPQRSKSSFLKILILGGFFVILMMAGIFYLLSNEKPEQSPVEVQDSIARNMTTSPVEKVITDVTEEDVLEEDPEIVQEDDEEVWGVATIIPDTSSDETVFQVKPLHWHVKVPEKVDTVKLEQNKFILEKELKQKYAQILALESDIEIIQKEDKNKFEQHYNEDTRAEAEAEKQERAALLSAKLSEKEQLEMETREIRKEKNQIEYHLQKSITENQRKESETKSRLLNHLLGFDIKQDYAKHNILIFNGDGNKIERALEQIFSVLDDSSSFRDFTKDTYTLPKERYDVSLYFDQKDGETIHWHVDPVVTEKKSAIIDTIKEYSRSIHYRSHDLLIFSISGKTLEDLKRRIRAMRIPFHEYSHGKTLEGRIMSGTETVSVYFSK